MGGQHKKNLRAEKAKVKLKGAKLPKGLNVTKTDFKVRKIEIREQLKEYSGQGAQRQLNLKETLSRLKHHNNKYRLDALRHVRDALKADQADLLLGHLNEVLQGVAGGALDIEREVRQESFKTLDALLETLPTSAVLPFFHILAAFLRCAMTHVQPQIQEDSLLMLDVLLLRVPAPVLAERSASSIVTHFIDMISRQRHDTQRANRVLTVRTVGQQTSVKWRTKVLQRLQQILGTLQREQDKAPRATARCVHYDASKAQYYNVLCTQRVDGRSLHAALYERERRAEDEQLRSYVEQLLPLLQDNWLEVRPQQQQQGKREQQQQLLQPDAAASLHVLLDIMLLLWQLVLDYEARESTAQSQLSHWLRHVYAASFVRHFLHESSYPYQQLPQHEAIAQTQRKRRKKQQAISSSCGELCIAQNVGLVQLLCHFYPQPTEEQREHYYTLLQYIGRCLRQLRSLQTNEQLRLVAALHTLLLVNGAALLQLLPHQMGSVMLQCIEAYVEQQYTTREGVATRLLNLLCEIVQQPSLYNGYGGELQFERFLSYLPQLLLKPSVADATLVAMSTLCRQKNKVFLLALAQSGSDILANLEKLQLTGDLNTEESRFEFQKRILNMFYYARDQADKEKFQLALQHLEKNGSERIAGYFKCILIYD